GVYIRCTIDDFNGLGFEYGDSLKIEFSNGYVMEDLPYYNGYYTLVGDPLLVAYPGYPYIRAGINNGDDLFVVAGLSESDTATVRLAERGKFAAIQDARNISYDDIRENYESDEEFANFREVTVGDIREGMLYRSASPCDNQHKRATYVDKLIKAAGVKFILDLADNDQKIEGYIDDPAFDCAYFLSLYNNGQVEPIALNMNYKSEDFRAKTTAGLMAMMQMKGPYLVHCTEGKDRTGFVCLLLEALCGASYDEIVADYMITYDNYYGISETEQRERYDVIIESVLDPMIESISNGADIKTGNLSAGAERFLLDGGMTERQVESLRERLTGK
ncbi:MAG: tyrosine-protein phosphatase, partial [Clostridia bacterium]|nr:tyrosine-protein phosphatase [Clostridia bacterium]